MRGRWRPDLGTTWEVVDQWGAGEGSVGLESDLGEVFLMAGNIN